jgi:hypothetical protein
VDLTEESADGIQEHRGKIQNKRSQHPRRNNGKQIPKKRDLPTLEKSVHCTAAEIKQYNPDCPFTPIQYNAKTLTAPGHAPPFFQPAPPPIIAPLPTPTQLIRPWHNPTNNPWNLIQDNAINTPVISKPNPFTNPKNPFRKISTIPNNPSQMGNPFQRNKHSHTSKEAQHKFQSSKRQHPSPSA